MAQLKHEQLVKNFLNTKGLPESYLHYDNVLIYTKAKQTLNLSVVSVRDRKIINKFIKNWVIHKGDIDPMYIKQMYNITKHYAYKLKNSALRNARLQRKKNLKLSKA